MKDPREPDLERNKGTSGGLYSRKQIREATLVVISGIILYGCWIVARPFLSAIVWALALAVVTLPLQTLFEKRVGPGWAALLCLVIVVAALLTPAALVTERLIAEARDALPQLEKSFSSDELLQSAKRFGVAGRLLSWLESGIDLNAEFRRAAGTLGQWASAFVGGLAWVLTQTVIMLLTLFYFLRDRRNFLRFLKGLIPLSSAESDELFRRIAQTTHAALYGNLFVKLLQGILTGVMFWILGLPAPVLFGAAAALAALLPIAGTFLVWGPAVIWLVVQGSWIKGIVMAVWGLLLVSLVDNLLYPYLVAAELRLHPLSIFISVFGGLIVFGFTGLVLGPIILGVAVALLNVWQIRAQHEEA
jgi:predicted PurR-regulated permease PerM